MLTIFELGSELRKLDNGFPVIISSSTDKGQIDLSSFHDATEEAISTSLVMKG